MIRISFYHIKTALVTSNKETLKLPRRALKRNGMNCAKRQYATFMYARKHEHREFEEPDVL